MIVILIAMYIFRPTKLISNAYRNAEENTRFQPTYFLIYDNSTQTECNRLIRIMPFNWIIWAINEDIYIVENTSAIICPLGTTPAVQVTNDIYTMATVCLNISLQSIINLYSEPAKVFYDISESSVPNKFTVLDALNILLQKYITITFEDDVVRDERNLATITQFNIDKKRITTEQKILARYESIKKTTLDQLFKNISTQHSNESSM